MTTPIQNRLAGLQATPQILPSLLLCDFGNLQREIETVTAAGVQCLHLDVMDGHFVPNFTYGMTIVRAVRKLTELPLDVHLMVEAPHRYLAAFREAGADHLTIHVEACEDVAADVQAIHDLGATAGLAINPDTPWVRITPYIPLCELVLVMSVPAGFGGQTFRGEALQRVGDIRRQFGDRILVEMDGGIDESTIASCVAAGADLLVVGSAIFKHTDYAAALRRLRDGMPTVP